MNGNKTKQNKATYKGVHYFTKTAMSMSSHRLNKQTYINAEDQTDLVVNKPPLRSCFTTRHQYLLIHIFIERAVHFHPIQFERENLLPVSFGQNLHNCVQQGRRVLQYLDSSILQCSNRACILRLDRQLSQLFVTQCSLHLD